MRSIGLIILITLAFTWAETPPPPPRSMNIYMNDGTVDSIYCSRVDPAVGVTFHENGMKMKVGLSDLVDPDYQVYKQSVLWYFTSKIDSITFDYIGPPPTPPEPTSVGSTAPPVGSILTERPAPK